MISDRPPFRKPPTAQEAVLAQLRRAIVSGELRPGEPIRQTALADRFGVSRVPLREALKILEGEGQVTYRPHRGYVVTELKMDDLLEVYRIRELLEGEAARHAVPRLSKADILALEVAASQVDAAADRGDLLGMAAANRQFHFGLIEAAGMPRLTRLVRILWDATDVYRSVYYNVFAHRAVVSDEHARIVEAARRRDGAEVVRLLDEHRANAIRGLAELLSAALRPD